FEIVNPVRHHRQKAANHFAPAGRRLERDATDADIAGHHPLTGKPFENFQDFFALAETIEKNRHGAHVDGVGPQPDQVRRNALKFNHQYADVLSAFRNFQTEQFLDRQAVNEVVAQRIEIVHPVGQGDRLRIRFALAGFFDAGVKITKIGYSFDHGYAVQFEPDAKH